MSAGPTSQLCQPDEPPTPASRTNRPISWFGSLPIPPAA